MSNDCCPTPISRRVLLGSALTAAAVAATTTATAPTALAAGSGSTPRVLVFTATNGYRHASIPKAIKTIKGLGRANGFAVDATEDPAAFTDRKLDRYSALVFANTVGIVLTPTARKAIERFVMLGGGWVGVHAAADTEYDWDFYTELLAGGRFMCHPINNQPGTIIREAARHPATRHLPKTWDIPKEEFYSFKTNVRGSTRVLLSIDESSYVQDPNTSYIPGGFTTFPNIDPTKFSIPMPVSGTMGDHPMSWTHKVGRGLSFYTALGHEPAMYSNPDYRRHLLGGLMSAILHGERNRA